MLCPVAFYAKKVSVNKKTNNINVSGNHISLYSNFIFDRFIGNLS